MVSEFNREKRPSENYVQTFDDSQSNVMVSKHKWSSRVPEHLIRLFDQPSTNQGESITPKYDERKSHHYEIRSSENISADISETDNNEHDYREHATITYGNNNAVTYEQSEYDDANEDFYNEQDIIHNEQILPGHSISEQETMNSEEENNNFKENEFQYTRDPNFLLVKNLKNKFENHN